MSAIEDAVEKRGDQMFDTDYDDVSTEEKSDFFEQVKEDVRYEDFLNGCYECGICVASCPSARFYDYSPRRIAQAAAREDFDHLYEEVEDHIWECSQCFSCNRCPRENSPGGVVTLLREAAVKNGLESAQDAMEGYQRVIYKIMSTGTQVSPDMIQPEAFPDWGPSAAETAENMEEWRKALPAESLHTTDTAWNVSEETINQMFLIWHDTGVMEFVENVDPGITMILNDMMEEKMEEAGYADEEEDE